MPGPILCASRHREDPLSRSYRVNLPSSLTMNLPSASVYSTRLRVSVYGTGACALKLSGFSRKYDYPHYCTARRLSILSGSPNGVDLPAPSIGTPFNVLSVRTRRCHNYVSTIARAASKVILNFSSIDRAFRLGLRTRLTLRRLTLLRKPWSCGEGASHPLYRYLYLHLLFHTLQHSSR